MSLDGPTPKNLNRRFIPGTNLPRLCGHVLDGSTRCQREPGHDGYHRRRARRWDDDYVEVPRLAEGGPPEDTLPDTPPVPDLMHDLMFSLGMDDSERDLLPEAEGRLHHDGATGRTVIEVEPDLDDAIDRRRFEEKVLADLDVPRDVALGPLKATGGLVDPSKLVTLGEGGPGQAPDPVERVLPPDLDRQAVERFLPPAAVLIGRLYEAEDRAAAEALAAAIRPRLVFRSVAWDGPAPTAGDIVLHRLDAYRVVEVAAGPGPGQWRLTVTRCRVIRWRGQDPEPSR